MKAPYVLLVAGSRHLECYDVFYKTMGVMLAKWGTPTKIISGGCRGVGAMAKKYATEMKYEFQEYPADWYRYGAKAGPMRNTIMVDLADKVLAFVDEQSKGTWDTIKKARKFPEKELIVIKVEEIKK
jgi:hypothetical protein